MTRTPEEYVNCAWDYCEHVVTGKIAACKHVKQACARTLKDWELAQTQPEQFPYTFDPYKAWHALNFIERMCHVEGELAGHFITLEPWQVWIVSQVFGWTCVGGTRDGLRRFRRAYIEVPRGNGKSAMSSPIALYMLAASGEEGAQVFSAATSQNQARITFDVAKRMAQQPESAALMRRLGVKVNAHTITVPTKFNRFVPLSAQGKRLDGKNISFALVDELHAHPTREVWDNLVSGAAKRKESLIWAITTAGFDIASIGFEQRTYLEKILEGSIADHSTFGVIYTIDAKDDWKNPKVWQKANPNWAISVDPHNFEVTAKQAIAVAANQPNFKTKHLNVWSSDSSRWADIVAWRNALEDGTKNADGNPKPVLKITDFDDNTPCWIGVDLSSHTDMTAKVLVFQKWIDGVNHVYAFPTFYLPEAAITKGRNASYNGWVIDGYIQKHTGETIDLAAVERDIVADCKKYNVKEVCFDKWEARNIIQNLMQQDISVIDIPQNVITLSEPTKFLETLVLNSRLHYVNPVMLWNASNVFVTVDHNGNVKPKKERPESSNKIDGISALLNALTRVMNVEPPSRYETAGFRVF